MKKFILITSIFLLNCLILNSCRKKECSEFTSNQLSFLVYNKGDQFKLKDEINGDTLIFEVYDKYIDETIEDRDYFGDYLCYQHAYFKLTSGGGMGIVLQDGVFSLATDIVINPTRYGGNNNNMRYIDTISINNVTYHNTYLFKGRNSNLYFSKNAGFLKIEEQETGKALYTIVE